MGSGGPVPNKPLTNLVFTTNKEFFLGGGVILGTDS